MPARLVYLALLLAAPLLAAPAPVEPPDEGWQRVLPEDVDGLLVLDVKQLMDSPLVKKGLKGKLPALLSDQFLVPVRLEQFGVDPAKDLRQVVIAQARSHWTDKDGKPTHGSGGLIVFRTAKTEAALRATLADLVKAGKASESAEGDVKLFELRADAMPAFAAVLPGGGLAISPNRLAVAKAAARIKAGKRAAFKNAEMAKFVKGLKGGPMLQGVMLGETVVGTSSNFNGGKGAPPVVMLQTLSDNGFAAVRFKARIKDTIKAGVDLECKDAGTAEKKAKEITGGIEAGKLVIGGQIMMMAQLKAVLKILDSATSKQMDKTVRVEGEIEAEVFEALDLLMPGGGGPPPVKN